GRGERGRPPGEGEVVQGGQDDPRLPAPGRQGLDRPAGRRRLRQGEGDTGRQRRRLGHLALGEPPVGLRRRRATAGGLGAIAARTRTRVRHGIGSVGRSAGAAGWAGMSALWDRHRAGAVAAGGALGATVRWGVVGAVEAGLFPWPVLALNVVGSALLGVLLAEEWRHPRARLLLHDLGG